MNEQEKPEELIQAKNFIDEFKFDEAERLVKSFEVKLFILSLIKISKVNLRN